MAVSGMPQGFSVPLLGEGGQENITDGYMAGAFLYTT